MKPFNYKEALEGKICKTANDMYSLKHFSLLNELISQFERESDLCDLSFAE